MQEEKIGDAITEENWMGEEQGGVKGRERWSDVFGSLEIGDKGASGQRSGKDHPR